MVLEFVFDLGDFVTPCMLTTLRELTEECRREELSIERRVMSSYTLMMSSNSSQCSTDTRDSPYRAFCGTKEEDKG